MLSHAMPQSKITNIYRGSSDQLLVHDVASLHMLSCQRPLQPKIIYLISIMALQRHGGGPFACVVKLGHFGLTPFEHNEVETK